VVVIFPHSSQKNGLRLASFSPRERHPVGQGSPAVNPPVERDDWTLLVDPDWTINPGFRTHRSSTGS